MPASPPTWWAPEEGEVKTILDPNISHFNAFSPLAGRTRTRQART